MNTGEFLTSFKQHIFSKHGTQSAAATHWRVSNNFVSLVVTGQRVPNSQMLSDMGMKIVKTTTVKYRKVK